MRARLALIALLVVAASALLVGGARLHRSVTADRRDFGPGETSSAIRPSSATRPSSGIRSPSATPASGSPSRPTTTVRHPSALPSAPAGVPARVVLPDLGVSAEVVPVTAAYDLLTVPDDPGTLGWWTGSALAAAGTGTTVIDGHVDSATAGPGALYRLTELHSGSRIHVELAGGGVADYSVMSRHFYLKSAGLPRALFVTSGAPQLVLISCGGRFDPVARSYESNVVVIAQYTPAR